MDLLTDDEIASRIRMVGPWEHDSEDKMLIRETVFKDFMEAMGFLNKLAEAAEKLNHHPDMTLCEYNRVIITTTTHDAGGITDNDIRLAQGFEEILEVTTKGNGRCKANRAYFFRSKICYWVCLVRFLVSSMYVFDDSSTPLPYCKS